MAAAHKQFAHKHFLCHLTGEILDDPVWGADGHVYERTALVQLLNEPSDTPTTTTTTTTTTTPTASTPTERDAIRKALTSSSSQQPPLHDARQLQLVIQKLLFLVDRPFSVSVAEGVVDDMNKQVRRTVFTKEACLRVKNETQAHLDLAKRERELLLKHDSLGAARRKIEQQEKEITEKLAELEKRRRLLQARNERISKHDVKLDEYEKKVWSIVNGQSRSQVEGDDQCHALERQVDMLRERVEHLKHTNISNEAFHIWHEGSFGIINGFRLGRLPTVQIEWAEVNAAWGQAALLLTTLANKIAVTFQRFRVIPMGSYSKIAKIGEER